MLTNTTLWTPSNNGNILRVLSQSEDGSFLYSWTPHSISIPHAPTYIRHYNPSNDVDQVMLISKHYVDFASASLSTDHQLIAFTVQFQQTSSKRKHFDIVIGNDAINAGFLSKEIEDTHPFRSVWLDSNEIQDDGVLKDRIYSGESQAGCSINPQIIIHKSYLAQVYPTGWFMKFNTDGKLKQQVIFTDFHKERYSGDLKLMHYEVILTMYKESIGLYNIVIENKNTNKTNLPSAFACTHQTQMVHSRVYGKPNSELIANNVVWSQWHAPTQRLYYVVPVRNLKKTKVHTSGLGNRLQFNCVQFFASMPRQKVLDVDLDIGFSKRMIRRKSFLCSFKEMDPSISGPELNMRLCLFNESGSMCLCWQEIPLDDTKPKWNYSIAVLNKDIVMHCPYNVACCNVPVSFIPLGPNLVVHCRGHFVHLYDIESMSCDTEKMENGLCHMHLQESFIPALSGRSLEYLMPYSWPDESDDLPESREHSVMSDSVDSVCSISSIPNSINASVCYDHSSTSFILIQFDYSGIGKAISDHRFTAKNRIFLTRQAVLSTRGSNFSPDPPISVCDSIMQDPTDPGATGVLAQLLISTTSLEIGDLKHSEVPPSMIPLFPVTLPNSSLHRMILDEDFEAQPAVYAYMDVKREIESQVEQYIATISSSPRSPVLAAKRRPAVVDHGDQNIKLSQPNILLTQEFREALWYRTLSATKCGPYTEYDLECIREELTILHGSLGGQFYDKNSSQQTMLQDRLSKLFKSDFLRSGDMMSSNSNLLEVDRNLTWGSMLSFLDEAERDGKSENIMVLTNEKLCDHLSAHFRNVFSYEFSTSSLDPARLARDYVLSELRAVYHTLTLMMMKSGVPGFDRSLCSPASAREQNLLFGLNQFQLVCTMICFPLPNGFHTFVTCLTFCCLLSRHTSLDGKAHVVDVQSLQTSFFDYVDKELVFLTDRFVDRTLKELGNKNVFSPIVRAILKRTKRLNVDYGAGSFGDLLLWNHPEAKLNVAKACLKEININANFCPLSSDISLTGESLSRKRTTSTPMEQTVSSYLKEIASSSERRERSKTISRPQSPALRDESFPERFAPHQVLTNYVEQLESKTTLVNNMLPSPYQSVSISGFLDHVALQMSAEHD
ncbi:unnamed protein product [Clavelina lepadiformis]|uniref:Uncharacterized protein n=1 Tax=Clavelina lepadiformis TaxID=159417 RepID=A0ABP0GSE3_CLALP